MACTNNNSYLHTPHDVIYRRSKLEPIRLIVTIRMGNKKATLVDNLDYYGISPVDVVHQVQRIAAASATGTSVTLYLYTSVITPAVQNTY